MTRHPHDPHPPGLDADLLLRLSARWLLDDPDRERFMRRLAETGPALFADALTDDPEQVRREPMRWVMRGDAPQFFRGLAWMIASAIALPSENWQPRRQKLPGRNEPCLCGSLRKFKHCCARLIEHAPPLDATFMTALVVQAMPARDWPALVGSQVPPLAVATAAHDLAESGQHRKAVQLLEPWSKAPAPWPESRVDLLDLLADLYLDLNHPRKRRALAQAMVERGGKAVQSLGWQRLSMMAADAGDPVAARDAFEKAQRLTPDDPRIALLEVTTLIGTGALARAHERAAFHARRMSRLPEAKELSTEIESMQAIARGELDHMAPPGQGDAAPARVPARAPARQRLDELVDWVQGLPPPRLRLDLRDATADDLGELKPANSLRAAVSAWHQAMLDLDDAPLDRELERWLPLLKRTPALLDGFDVLNDLVERLGELPPGVAVPLQALLQARAGVLWDALRQRFPKARCEWACLGNRGALALLVRDVQLDASPRAERSFDRLRALVEVINPNDNHGLRNRLGAVLLRRGDVAAALALAERYPDDFAAMRLLQVRALLAAQRLDEAGAALDAALKANPHLSKFLKSRRVPAPPRVDAFVVGSEDEARIAVAEQHDLWRDQAVQQWLAERADPGGPVQLTLT